MDKVILSVPGTDVRIDELDRVTELTSQDDLVIEKFNEGTKKISATILKGLKGDVGATGAEGPQGVEGPSGHDSTIPGPPGLKGDTGLPGQAGPKGDTGLPGGKGDIGPAGEAGPAGADSTVEGPAGAQGEVGPAGADSHVPGPRGKDGISNDYLETLDAATPLPDAADAKYGKNDTITKIVVDVLTLFVHNGLTGVDAAWVDMGIIQGHTGIQGATGAQGEVGPAIKVIGLLGVNEEPKPPTAEAQGECYLKEYIIKDITEVHALVCLETGIGTGVYAWEDCGTVQGPQGAEGPQGVQGNPGPQGNPGKDGLDGAGLTAEQEADVNSIPSLTAKVNDTYNKGEVDAKIAAAGGMTPEQAAALTKATADNTKQDGEIAALTTRVDNTYNKGEVDTAITDAITAAGGMTPEQVAALAKATEDNGKQDIRLDGLDTLVDSKLSIATAASDYVTNARLTADYTNTSKMNDAINAAIKLATDPLIAKIAELEATTAAHTTALGGMSFWSGNQNDYNLEDKVATTLYVITG